MESYDVYLQLENEYVKLDTSNNYEIQMPITINQKIDGTLNSGHFEVKTTYAKQIKPFTKCKIIRTLTDLTTETYYFYTANTTKRKLALYKTEYMHEVYLIDPTKILERYIIGARTFSVGSSFFTTYEDLINLMIETCYTKSGSEANKINITLDKKGNDVFSLPAKEMFTNKQTTLFEALNEIGQRINAFPRMKDFETLTFDFRESKEEYIINEVDIFSEISKQNIDDLATNIQSQIPNVIDLDSPMYNLNDKMGYSLRSETVRITEDTGVLILDKPIYKIKSIKVAPTKDTKTTLRKNSTSIISPFLYSLDITEYIYEKKQWEQLPYYDRAGAENDQLATLYFTQNTNKIEGFFGYHDNFWERAGQTIQTLLNRAVIKADKEQVFFGLDIDEILGLSGVSGNKYIDLEYIVEYYPTDEIIVNAYKERWETENRETNTLIYNQNANIINFNYYGENLQATIKRLGNEELEINMKIKGKTIPKLTQRINIYNQDYFISDLSIEFYRNFKKVKILADKNFSKFSPDISLNSQIRLFNIPNDNYIIDRIIKVDNFLFIDKVFKRNDFETNTKLPFKYLLMNSFLTRSSYLGSPLNKTVPLASITLTGTNVPLYEINKPINFLTTSKAVIFSFGFNENIAGGYQKVSATDSFGAINKLVPYTNEKGEFVSCYIGINSPIDRNNYNANITPELSYDVEIEDKQYFNFYLDNIKKDVREIIKFNFQFNVLSDNKDYIIGDSFLSGFSNLFKNDLFKKRYVYFSNNKLTSDFKEDITKTATEIVDRIATIGTEMFKLDKGDYDLDYIGYEENNYLKITISEDLKSVYNSYAILDENYKTIFISNDLEADKIYFNFANNYND